MPVFSIIKLDKQIENVVEGVWLHDHIGSLESATKCAREEEVLNHQLKMAVIDSWGFCQIGARVVGRIRLDSDNIVTTVNAKI